MSNHRCVALYMRYTVRRMQKKITEKNTQNKHVIIEVKGRQILDSRGNPTDSLEIPSSPESEGGHCIQKESIGNQPAFRKRSAR